MQVITEDNTNPGSLPGFPLYFREWVPIPNLPGLYRVYTETSCDFDNCGCGFERIQVLSEAEYTRLREASDKIEEAGSLY